MREIFSGTLLIDIVIAVTVIEWVLLTWWHRRTGRGIPMSELRATLMAGLYLMLALRASMVSAPWYLVALLLLAAGLSHAADLWRRWSA
ncbi:MAG: hypothetical protein RI928_1547 [Pseudomonadota bacterium]